MKGRDRVRSLQSRLVLGAMALAGLWVVTFWLWPTRAAEPAILFADEPGARKPERATVAMVAQEAPPKMAALSQTPARQAEPPAVKPEPKPQAAPPAALQEPAPRAAGVIPPTFTTRTVQAGQTMQSIAKAVYGDGGKWTVISRANPKVDPVKLKAGMELRIPVDPENVQGVPASAAREQAAAPPATERAAPVRREHVVAQGDTLSGISKQVYGTTAHWRAILNANKDQLSEPEDIRAGMTLVIPAKPER